MVKLIKEIENLKTELFDKESKLLGKIGRDDYSSDKMQKIAKLRKQQELLTRVILRLNCEHRALFPSYDY